MSREEETVSGPDKATLDNVLNYLKTRNLKVNFWEYMKLVTI